MWVCKLQAKYTTLGRGNKENQWGSNSIATIKKARCASLKHETTHSWIKSKLMQQKTTKHKSNRVLKKK
jgi:hypothetical protein